MHWTKITGVSLMLLAGCASTGKEKADVSWSECARAHAVAWVGSGSASSWPVATEVPEGVPVQVVPLGPHPPEAINDAFFYTLHLLASRNAVYIEQTGGFAGVHHLYGPMSLAGRCPKQVPGVS